MLWPPEGSAIGFGAVVPVHFKSNITKTYAVGVPGSSDKEELELWRVEPYRTRSKAKAAAAGYGEYASLLGVAARDGLLLRAKPDNVSAQTYRLRLGQPVKLLRKTQGAVVETGGAALPGDWYYALAEDGTSGYVFSNQLELWNAAEGPMPDLRPEAPASGVSVSALFDTVWRPDYFDSMTASGLLDLSAYRSRYGIFTDPARKQIRVERPEFSKVYRYDSIAPKEDGSFEIVPGGASFYFTKAGSLVFAPAREDLSASVLARFAEEKGPDSIPAFEFVRHGKDVHDAIAAEERRRLSALSDFVAGGERYESDAYGVLIVTRSARFTWVAYGALVPDVIPEGSGETGTISMDLYLAPGSPTEWEGVFTLRFDAAKAGLPFAYQRIDDELLLALLPADSVRNAVVTVPSGLEPVASMNRYR